MMSKCIEPDTHGMKFPKIHLVFKKQNDTFAGLQNATRRFSNLLFDKT